MRQRGFTLIEILIDIALLVILMAIVLIAINPAQQLKKSRQVKIKNDILVLTNGLRQWAVGNGGDFPIDPNGHSLPIGAPGIQIGTATYDVCADLVPEYMVALPRDYLNENGQDIKDCSQPYTTGYYAYIQGNTVVITDGPNSETSGVLPTDMPTPTPTPTIDPGGPIPTDTPTPIPSNTPVPPTPTRTPTPVPTTPPSNNTYYLSTMGSDSNNGAIGTPFRSFAKALNILRPGDKLYVRGGTYQERLQNPSITAGTASDPILVSNYPGETPVIQGLLWLSGESYWTISGINVTWDMVNGQANEHMLKFSGGTNWTFTNAEISNAHSFAAILVTSGATNWTISNSYIHDTADCRTECVGTGAPHTVNQDHLMYISDTATSGIIERNILVNSPNGRAVKLGPPSSGPGGPDHIIVRYNTMVNNLGPSNVNLSYGTHDCEMYRNIMVQTQGGTYNNINNTSLGSFGFGTNNIASNNVGWLSKGVVESDPTYLINGGGNIFINPQLDATWHPQNSSAQQYGRYAP